MDFNAKYELMKGLADAFTPENNSDIRIDEQNRINDKGGLDAMKVSDISLTDLRKVRAVIEDQEKRFEASSDPNRKALLPHIRIAKLCVDEILSQRNRLKR